MATPTPKGASDDPRQAPESGDPRESGQSRTAPDNDNLDGKNDVATNSEHWESGRQRSN